MDIYMPFVSNAATKLSNNRQLCVVRCKLSENRSQMKDDRRQRVAGAASLEAGRLGRLEAINLKVQLTIMPE